MQSVIAGSPLFLLLYGAALLLLIFDLVKRSSGYGFPILSAVLFTGTTIWAMISGAGYEEVGMMVLIFLVLNVFGFLRSGGKR